MSGTAVLEEPQSVAKLVRPREEALAHLQSHLKKGLEIRGLRIRTGSDLDEARAQKLDWTNKTIDLLNSLFDNPTVSERCNDWVGKIYPEYAEFSNFVEQFCAEMDHRIKRLKGVIKEVQQMHSESRPPVVPVPAATVPAAPATPTPAPAAAEPIPQLLKPELSGLLICFGIDEASKNAVMLFLESLDVEVALVEPDQEESQTIAEALEENTDATFAVILQGDVQKDRAFDLGFCVGRLGLRRVCLLHPPQVQPNGDSKGLAKANLDPNGGWQLQLARHLKRAGLPVDLNRLC